MRTQFLLLLVGFFLLVARSILMAEQSAPAKDKLSAEALEFFEKKIRPLLMDRCYECHSAQSKKLKGGLRLDSRDGVLKGGDSGPALMPGEPEKSLLIKAVRYTDKDLQMPPKQRLPPDQIADLETWVKSGAPDPRTSDSLTLSRPGERVGQASAQAHWAFQPVKPRPVPNVRQKSWVENAVDRFILAKLETNGLTPTAPASRPTLIRRAYFDLIGLPPTAEEVEAFVQDKSGNAFAKVVERLLGSPHYGERWGRHWMDVARYADTAGDNADYPVPEARFYRDYIIESFNSDKPYDQFLQEQLAGDLLAKQGPREQYADRVIATGFIALSRRYATAPFELWHLTVEDTIETVGRAFMGLTLRCARCHDHKYDPVTKEDYYALYGIFASTQYPYAGSEEFSSKNFPRSGFVPLLPPEEVGPRLKAHDEKIKERQAEIKRVEQEGPLAKQNAELKHQIDKKSKQIQELEAKQQKVDAPKAELAELQKQRDEANRQLQDKLKALRGDLKKLEKPGLPPNLPCAYAVSEAKPVDANLQIRGNPEEQGPVIKRGPPKFLGGESAFDIPQGSSGRLELAQWLTQPQHPLTARVMVNRIWQHHFGKGLVATPSNFGLRGDAPTHPELLDYLAARLVESGWSIKTMHRLIMLSRTYQLSSASLEANVAKDPGNQWYCRFNRRRLEAEAIRDAMLAVTGNLDWQKPAQHPFPEIHTWGFSQHSPFKAVYESKHRSVFLMTQRLVRHPYLALFDSPDANITTDARSESTVPLQALYLMNNPFVQEQASAVARRLLGATNNREERMRLATELVWSRQLKSKEAERGVEYLDRYQQELARTGAPPEQIEMEAWTSYARVLLTANEFVYVD